MTNTDDRPARFPNAEPGVTCMLCGEPFTDLEHIAGMLDFHPHHLQEEED